MESVNDRSALRLTRARESKGWKEVEGWDCAVVAGGFPAFVEKQTFEGSHSRCKHADGVAVVAVKAGADNDGVYGECLRAFYCFICDTPSVSQPFFSLNFVTASAAFMATGALHKCLNKDRSTMIRIPVHSAVYLHVFLLLYPWD